MIIDGKSPRTCIVRAAIQEALRSKSNYPFAAVIYDGNKILIRTHNIRTKTHPNGSGPHRTTHAEVRAVNIAKSNRLNLSELSIFILGISRNGIRTSKPCNDCMLLLTKERLQIGWAIGDDVQDELTEAYKYAIEKLFRRVSHRIIREKQCSYKQPIQRNESTCC